MGARKPPARECAVSEITFGSVELAFAYNELSDPQFTHGKELIALLGISRGDRVLDIGCGNGHLAAFAVEHVGAQACIVGQRRSPPRALHSARNRGQALTSSGLWRAGFQMGIAPLRSAVVISSPW
jgi:protein-L-isoaspartate O-methyltransferase